MPVPELSTSYSQAAMASEAEQEYTEIVEMSTFQPSTSTAVPKLPEVSLSPAALSETQFETYISMDKRAELGESSVPGPSGLNRRQTRTFRKYSVVDDEPESVYQYENLGFTGPEKFTSTEEIVSPNYEAMNEPEIFDDSLSLRTKLKHKRQRLEFVEYVGYAVDAVYEEVEKIVFLDVAFFVLSAIAFALGMAQVDGCTASPTVPVIMSVSGGVDAVTNLCGAIATLTRKQKCKHGTRDGVRVARMVLFFIHIYGLDVVYKILPPEEEDINSNDYCNSYVYWIAFAFFHLTTLTSLAILIGMIAASICV